MATKRVNFRTFTVDQVDDFARECASQIRKARTFGNPTRAQQNQMDKELMMCNKIIKGEEVTSMLVYSPRLFTYMKKCPIVNQHTKS